MCIRIFNIGIFALEPAIQSCPGAIDGSDLRQAFTQPSCFNMSVLKPKGRMGQFVHFDVEDLVHMSKPSMKGYFGDIVQ